MSEWVSERVGVGEGVGAGAGEGVGERGRVEMLELKMVERERASCHSILYVRLPTE